MKSLSLLIVAAVGLGLSAAGPVLAETTTTTVTPYTSGAATLDHPGRLLASNCFQCHGTNGHGMESLAGKPAAEIAEEMYEMQRAPIGADIMHVFAYGLTTEQIDLVADYLSKQQR